MRPHPFVTFFCPILFLAFCSCKNTAEKADPEAVQMPGLVQLKTEMDRMSYSMGVTYGRQFWLMGISIDSESFVKGYRDWKSGNSEVTEGQIQSALSQLEQALGARGGKPFSLESPYLGQGKRLSYIAGASLASQIIAQRYGFHTEPLLRGCLDVFGGANDSMLLLPTETITSYMLIIPDQARIPVDSTRATN